MKRKLKPNNKNFLSDVKALLSSELDSNYIIDINKVKIKPLKRSDVIIIPFNRKTAKELNIEPNDVDFLGNVATLLSSNLNPKYIIGKKRIIKYLKKNTIIRIPICLKTKKDETNEKLSKLVIDSKMFEQ